MSDDDQTTQNNLQEENTESAQELEIITSEPEQEEQMETAPAEDEANTSTNDEEGEKEIDPVVDPEREANPELAEADEGEQATTESDLNHLGSGKKTALKTSTGKQAKNTGRNWYVIHTYSGYEDAVEKALRQRIESLNMHELIFDIIVPKESTITIKKGEHVTEKKRLFPGYVLVEMVVTDESWYVVRNTPNVTGFVGAGTTPVPVLPEEFDVIKKHLRHEEPKFNIQFQVGDTVTINDGPFKSYEGLINTVDQKKGKVKVLVTLFGRETPVELDFVQVNKK